MGQSFVTAHEHEDVGCCEMLHHHVMVKCAREIDSASNADMPGHRLQPLQFRAASDHFQLYGWR